MNVEGHNEFLFNDKNDLWEAFVFRWGGGITFHFQWSL